MTSDLLQSWSNFFAAQLGAAATLTGLLFVAVSINLSRILQFSHLPRRAAEALLELLSVLFITTFALIPHQSLKACGIEFAVTGAVSWCLQSAALLGSWKLDRQYVNLLPRIAINQLPPLPFLISGVLLIANRPSGIYWIVPGILLSFAAGIFGAWVLLIEIQR